MLKTAFVWMLNCTVQASIVLVYIMLFRLVVRRASRKWCYLLWLPAALRLVCTWTPFFLRWHGSPLPRIDFFQTQMTPSGMKLIGAMNATARGDAMTRVDFLSSDAVNITLFTALSLIWLAGMAAFAIKGIMDYRHLRTRLEGARQIDGGLYPVYSCVSVSAPFSMGILHKRVYVPENLDARYLRAVIAHEHTHLSRHDPLWKLIAYALRCIHWMNPLMHIACRLWGSDMEYTCDERVLKWMGDDMRAEYCKALLNVQGELNPLPCPVAFCEGGLKGRIKNLLKKRRLKALWGFLAVLIVFNVYRIGLTRSFGLESCRLKVDEDIHQRLVCTLDRMASDPLNANASGYFSYETEPSGTLSRSIIRDDDVRMRWIGAMLHYDDQGWWYLYAPTDGKQQQGCIIALLYQDELPVEPSGFDPRRETGQVVYLDDYTEDLSDLIHGFHYDYTYCWQYHCQTELAEIFAVIYTNSGIDPNPVYTELENMMDHVLSAYET